MAAPLDDSGAEQAQPVPPPPLADGERLARPEFERRYAPLRNVRAELIEGVVYVQAPVRHKQHGNPHLLLITWLGTYIGATPGVDGGDNSSIRLDMENEPQPDILLRIEAACGGATIIDDDGYLNGPPELIAEIAASTTSYDLHEKLNAYRRNGVQEYLVWRVLDREFDWFTLRAGQYEPLPIAESGLIQSEVFPGLWLDTPALLRGDLAAAVASLKQGLASKAHAAFCRRLKKQREDGR